MKKKSKISTFLLLFILIILATSPAFALGEGNRNLLLIGVMAISPIIIMMNRKLYRSDIFLLLFMASIILLPLLFHPESMRWSTVLYSMMFGFTFIAYRSLLYNKIFSIENYKKFLMYLIYAYFLTLLIQQFCVLAGLPIFNLNAYLPSDPWKLNSLSAEPSHSAQIVGLLMYSYLVITEFIKKGKYDFRLDVKNDKWVWLAFVWTMVTMGSGMAFLFITIVLLKFVRFKTLLPLFVVIGIIIVIVYLSGVTAFERTYNVFIATLTLDPNEIIKADHSASMRIVPTILLFTMLNLNTLDGWVGHGIDYVGSFLSKILPGVIDGYSGGGLFQTWVEYGFISFIFFLIFSFSNFFRKEDHIAILFWFILVFLVGVNNQIAWLCMVIFLTNKYFYQTTTKGSL